MSWLAFSLVASVILTVVLNVALRLFPGARDRLSESLDRVAADGEPNPARVIVPWKAMLIGSLLLTVAINVVPVIFR